MSTGRPCDGYGIWGGGGNRYWERPQNAGEVERRGRPASRSVTSVVTQKPLRLQPVNADEQASMEWFVYRSAPKLPGAFASTFWTSILIQASSSERAVFHAVLTLSSVHRRTIPDDVLECNNAAGNEVFILRQCDKAMMHLRYHILGNCKASVTIALIVCAIFVHLEFLRGCYQTGLIHLRHGLGLLAETAQLFGDARNDRSNAGQTITDEWIVKIFRNLYIQARSLGQEYYYSWPNLLMPTSDVVVQSFQSIEDARQSLYNLVIRTLELRDKFDIQKSLSDEAMIGQLCTAQETIRSGLDNWLRALPSTTSSVTPLTSESSMDLIAWKLLRIYRTTVSIMLDTCLSPSESVFDNHTPIFQSIITQCVSIFHEANLLPIHQRRLSQTSGPVESVADIGCIMPLYYTAIKCRVHRIRWQAIKMLSYLPHKEGIWDSELLACIARKLVEIEERDQLGGQEIRRDWSLSAIPSGHDEWLSPEECRVRDVQVELPEGAKGKLGLKYIQQQGATVVTVKMVYDLKLKEWGGMSE